MKSRSILTLAILTLLAIARSASAASNGPAEMHRNQSDTGKMFHKLGRGVVNVFTCWVEIPRQIAKEWEKTDPVSGFAVGAAKGIGWGFARFASGIYETFTFPLPVPPDYAPLMEPEFVVTDVWGDPVPGITEFEANDPLYPGSTPIYPQRFRY